MTEWPPCWVSCRCLVRYRMHIAASDIPIALGLSRPGLSWMPLTADSSSRPFVGASQQLGIGVSGPCSIPRGPAAWLALRMERVVRPFDKKNEAFSYQLKMRLLLDDWLPIACFVWVKAPFQLPFAAWIAGPVYLNHIPGPGLWRNMIEQCCDGSLEPRQSEAFGD